MCWPENHRPSPRQPAGSIVRHVRGAAGTAPSQQQTGTRRAAPSVCLSFLMQASERHLVSLAQMLNGASLNKYAVSY